ncbi:acyltransferase [Atopobiaceae bacterium 24-176]
MARKRLVFVYVLNILAAFAVVMLHVSLDVFSPQAGGDPRWFTSFFLQAAFIFAVPVFFAVSGMNLLGYREKYDTRAFFAKRVRRVGVALLFGSAVCYLAYGLFPGDFWGAEGATLSLKGFVKGVLSNTVNDTYWFLYTIIYLYILTPLLSLAAGRKRLLGYLMACCVVSAVLLPLAGTLGLNRAYLDPLFGWATFANVSLLYYLGGFYLARYVNRPEGFPVPWQASVALYAASTAGMALLAATSNGFLGFDSVPGAYDSYWISTSSPLCVVQAASVFMCAMALEPRFSRLKGRGLGVLVALSGASLGVYLIQMPVINWIGHRLAWPGYEWLQDTVVRGLVVFAVAMAVSVIWCAAWGALKGGLGRLVAAGRR